MREEVRVRIGMVNFINTAPIYEVWKKKVHRPEWNMIPAVPTVLNHMLFQEELELAIVSSHEYALHPAKYRILGDLSISASGPVGSVFLFSKFSPEALDGQLVLLSRQSQTSASLVKIILESFYRVKPQYRTGNVLVPEKGGQKPAAVLAIGDEALKIASDSIYPFKLDLGEVWQQQTNLPFVYAVWAVREDFYRSHPGSVAEVHAELLQCLEDGLEDLVGISRQVAPRIPMGFEECHSYLKSMEYDLDNEKQKGLTLFYQYLIKRNEVPPQALPLKIIDSPGLSSNCSVP